MANKISTKMKLGNDKNLKDIGFDADIFANDAYEGMSFDKHFRFILTNYLIFFLLIVLVFILPSIHRENIKKYDATDSRSTVSLIYIQKQSYQPFINVFLANTATNKSEVAISADYQLDLYRGVTLYTATPKYQNNFNISNGDRVKLLGCKDSRVSRVEFHGHVKVKKGNLANLSWIWQDFNPVYGLSIFFIFSVCCFLLITCCLLVLRSINKLKSRTATNAQRFILISLVLISISMIPLPELSFFNILNFFHDKSSFFVLFYRSLFVITSAALTINLSFREEKAENLLYEITYIIMPFLLAAFYFASSDRLVSIGLAGFVFLILCFLIFSVIFIQKDNKEEFLGLITHIFIILPNYGLLIACLLLNVERFNRLEVLCRIFITTSVAFLSFIRWPFEDLVLEINLSLIHI